MAAYKIKIVPMTANEKNCFNELLTDEVAKMLVNLFPKDILIYLSNELKKSVKNK